MENVSIGLHVLCNYVIALPTHPLPPKTLEKIKGNTYLVQIVLDENIKESKTFHAFWA